MNDRPLSIKTNIIWNTAGNFVYLLSQWLLTYVVVLTLGYGEAGVFSLAMSIGNSLSTIATYTMRNYQVSDVAHTFSDSTYKASRYATSLVALAVCIVFIAANGYSSYIASCIVVFMIFKLSEAISDVYQGILQKESRMDFIGISFIIKGVSGVFAFTTAILVTRSLFLALLGLCLASFAVVIFYDKRRASSFSSKKAEPTQRSEIFALLKICLPIAVFGLLFNSMGQLPRYFLEAQLGTEMLGIYASVAMPVVIVQVSASFIFAPLATPFAIYLDKGDIHSFKRLFVKVLFFIGALSAVALLAFGLFGEWLLQLLLGPSITDYAYLVMPLVVCTILTAASWFLSTVLIITRKLKELLVASVLAFVIVTAGSIPAINGYGMNGASFVLIAALIVFVAGNAIALAGDIRQKKKR